MDTKPDRMNPANWYQHALINGLQTMLLLAIMAGFLGLLGWLLWGSEGIIIILLMGLTLMLLHPFFSPQLIIRLYHGQRLLLPRFPALQSVLTQLTQRSGLKAIPEIYYIPSALVNSFAIGRGNKAIIAITDGLLRSLNLREISAVFAHEMSHIRSNDITVMGIADLFCRLTSILSLSGQMLLLINLPLAWIGAVEINWLAILALLLAPLVSTLAQLGLSRTREYHADLNAARLTGDPEGLANALIKIDQVQGGILQRLFLPGKGIPQPSLLRTHPPTEERLRRLLALKAGSEYYPDRFQSLEEPSEHFPAGDRRHIRRRPRWHIGGLWH